MAFDDLQLARVRREVDEFIERRRPPEKIRDEVDLVCRIDEDDQSVVIYEIRPDWQDPDETVHTRVARMKYVKSRDVWKLYWMRRDLKWHKYPPSPEVRSLQEAIEIVDEDDNGCFWG